MLKTALAFGLAFATMFTLAAMTRPHVEQLVEGQQQCSNGTAVCLGDKNHKVRLQGPVSLESTSPAPVAFTLNTDGGLSTIATANNYLVSSSKALINYDFPQAQFKVDAFSCLDSPGVTIANCPFGSQLLLGVDQVLNGGTGNLTPYLSAANTVFVRECAIAGDAGVFNMPDASYIVRCIP